MPSNMRLAAYGAISTALTLVVIANAWADREQFYSACIHLVQSNSSLLVLLNMGLFLIIVFARMGQWIFFGELRAMEIEHLYERSWFAVTETCLAMTIFRDEFNVLFLSQFTLLLLAKIFHWVTQDRVDFMEQTPNHRLVFHARMIGIIGILAVVDFSMVFFTVDRMLSQGVGMMIIFGFEYTILLWSITATFVKYILNAIDLRNDTPWEEKSMYVFYLELIIDFLKLVTYSLFFVIVVNYYGLPLHIVRDIYVTFRNFIQRCKDLIQYRRATANMHTRYPTATVEELNATDRICIICREEMESLPGAGENPAAPAPAAAAVAAPGAMAGGASMSELPKKLPCGHIFHFRCLRSWLERQQSCPTCRRSVLDDAANANANPNANPNANAAQGARPQPQAQGVPQGPVLPQQPAGALAQPANILQALLEQARRALPDNRPPAAPFQPQAPLNVPRGPEPHQNGPVQPTQPVVPAHSAPSASAASSSSSAHPILQATATIGSNSYPVLLRPLLPSGQDAVSVDFDNFTDSQLQLLEGRSRQAVLARLRELYKVQTQLNSVIRNLEAISGLMQDGGLGTTTGSGAADAVSLGQVHAGPDKGKRPAE
ncbi:uncharacterized protein BJ171DRAFT_217087 [Polychytrium aggregatum]|uniref:uncharacterized protein n=1 Tax=Polychytrium aggregatum TaxID=110093 RepID=UPI0022FDEDFC|nr:uncharacterized protein BJ171DRAFT_217087 [Polychytrium aggregatum]KAI9199393.1 hypothetical protein BJ171DRAFT_217087 [Polychytrium aggregatum]